MTPAERARAVLAGLQPGEEDCACAAHAHARRLVTDAIAAAVEEEREACARICADAQRELSESMGYTGDDGNSDRCAQAIRARGTRTAGGEGER